MLAGTGGCQRPLLQCIINSQSLEDTQKYTLDKYTLEKYALAQEKLGDGGDLLGDDVNLLGDGGNLHCWGVIKDNSCKDMIVQGQWKFKSMTNGPTNGGTDMD